MQGTFTISLDFELHWGGFEKWPLKGNGGYEKYFLNTRKAIPEMLRLFEKYDVHVTWATVGMLFHKEKSELLGNAPDLKPSYLAHELSAYDYISRIGIGNNEGDDPFHYAPSLIEKILSTPNQELASHSFAHFYCNEAGQTVGQFREDLRAAQRAAANFNTRLRSLVFPRNQFNDSYLKVCFEEGITSVRSNPLDWFWNIQSTQSESMWKRLNRGLDAYLPIGKYNTYKLSALTPRAGYPLCIPASRLLRPYRKNEFFLNDMKIDRIKQEMSRAAKNGEVYHLWWHPHNFGNFPDESLQGLEQILKHYRSCQQQFGMQSLSMNEIAEHLLEDISTAV